MALWRAAEEPLRSMYIDTRIPSLGRGLDPVFDEFSFSTPCFSNKHSAWSTYQGDLHFRIERRLVSRA